MIRNPHGRRGSSLLGVAALTVLAGVLSSIVLSRSLDCYHASVDLELRLRCWAAAEGAVAVLRADPLQQLESLEVGRCRVGLSPAGADSDAPAVTRVFRVEAVGSNGRTIMLRDFQAQFTRQEDGTWLVASLH